MATTSHHFWFLVFDGFTSFATIHRSDVQDPDFLCSMVYKGQRAFSRLVLKTPSLAISTTNQPVIPVMYQVALFWLCISLVSVVLLHSPMTRDCFLASVLCLVISLGFVNPLVGQSLWQRHCNRITWPCGKWLDSKRQEQNRCSHGCGSIWATNFLEGS